MGEPKKLWVNTHTGFWEYDPATIKPDVDYYVPVVMYEQYQALRDENARLREAAQRERSKKQAEEAMVVFAQLSQLQALVRPFAELAKHLDGREFNTLHAILRNGTWIKVTMDDFMALKAALDATTPAAKGGDGE